MRYVVGVCWIVTALCAVAAIIGVLMFLPGPMPMQQKVIVGVACLCLGVLPYVFTKAIEGLWKT
jgi:hypothetical protein